MEVEEHFQESERSNYVPGHVEYRYGEPGTSSASDSGPQIKIYPASSRVSREHRSTKEINLAELRRRQNEESECHSSESGIIWHTKFLQQRRGLLMTARDLENPKFIFVDDRPIELSVDATQIQPQPDTKERIQQAAVWCAGPVITIEVFVETDLMPRRVLEIMKDSRSDQLALKRVSRRRLVVNSSYLATGLRDMVQYYPSFHSMKGKLIIPEPYAVLLHHFDSIEAMAGSPVSATMCMSTHDNNQKGIGLIKKYAKFARIPETYPRRAHSEMRRVIVRIYCPGGF